MLLFGLENIIQELFAELGTVNVFEDYEMSLIAIICSKAAVDPDLVREKCKDIIQSANEVLECDISCYLGKQCQITELQKKCADLHMRKKDNITNTNIIIEEKEEKKKEIEVYNFAKWNRLIFEAKHEELKNEIETLFEKLFDQNIDQIYLNMYISGFSYIMYKIINEKMINADGVEKISSLLNENTEIDKLFKLKQWTEKIIDTYFLYYENKNGISSAVKLAKQYIESNFDKGILRDDIARCVCLNADYLSRIFHKEIGLSISEYITKLRMEKAKEMLNNTKCDIVHISEACGYNNFTYFAKQFKRMYGISPGKFRKQNRNS